MGKDKICRGCGGELAETGTNSRGRILFNCRKCENNPCTGCVICKEPRTIWADDGKVCGLCALQWMEGKLDLTDEQIDDIKKWSVTIIAPFAEKK